jgi:hydrogenase maturation protease
MTTSDARASDARASDARDGDAADGPPPHEPPAPLLIIGIGNRWRQDDGIGPWIADRLGERGLPAIEHSGEGAGLIEAWCGARTVIVVDATASGAAAGTLYRLDAVTAELPRHFFRYSSHLFGLAEAIATARTLGRLPEQLIVHGIEGGDFGFGDQFTPAVAEAAAIVIERITDEAARITASDKPGDP